MSREKQMEDQSEVLYGGRREGGKRFAEMCAKAFENAEAHHENYDDIFAGYENNLEKAVALIEWQKQEIEGLTIRMNAFGLAIKRLAEERSEHFLLKENGEVVPPGEGEGQLPALLAAYGARGGRVMTLEPHLNAFVGLEQLENSGSATRSAYAYASADEAFDAAVTALKKILP